MPNQKLDSIVYKFSILPNFFQLIVKGEKTMEGRLRYKKYRVIKTGDFIDFVNKNKPIKIIRKKIINIYLYPSFELALKKHLKQLLPGCSLSEGINLYHKIYSQKKIKKLGVLLIKFR